MTIGLGGKMCSGKSDMAKYLKTKNFIELNFADKLKEIAVDLFGMDITKKDRRLLQLIGEKMREIDQDVWVNYILNKIKYINNSCEITSDFVIADVRYRNEIDLIRKSEGFTIYINRPEKERLETYKTLYGRYPTEEELNHSSESLSSNFFDFVIENNSDKQTLYNDINEIIKHINNNNNNGNDTRRVGQDFKLYETCRRYIRKFTNRNK